MNALININIVNIQILQLNQNTTEQVYNQYENAVKLLNINSRFMKVTQNNDGLVYHQKTLQ